MKRRPLALAAAAWAGLLAPVWIAGRWWVCHGPQCTPGRFDRALLEWVAVQRTPAQDLFYAAITWIGSLYLLLPLAVAAALVLLVRGRRREAWFPILALGGAAAIVRLIKMEVARPRPDLLPAIGTIPADPSYPSAHAAQIVALVAAALILAWREIPEWRFPAVAVGVSLAGGVCVSRLYLQAHYPTDVLAGIVTGLAWTLGLYAVFDSAAGR